MPARLSRRFCAGTEFGRRLPPPSARGAVLPHAHYSGPDGLLSEGIAAPLAIELQIIFFRARATALGTHNLDVELLSRIKDIRLTFSLFLPA